jgi:hypothetical protein
MATYFVRRPPGRRENLGAVALAVGVAAGVGALTFYLARVLLARERVVSPAEGRRTRLPEAEEEEQG